MDWHFIVFLILFYPIIHISCSLWKHVKRQLAPPTQPCKICDGKKYWYRHDVHTTRLGEDGEYKRAYLRHSCGVDVKENDAIIQRKRKEYTVWRVVRCPACKGTGYWTKKSKKKKVWDE